MTGLSAQIAAFIARTRYEDLPPAAIAMSKRCILDGIGVSLGASGLGEGCRAFIELATAQGGKEQCTILGEPRQVAVEAAAFVNGALAHALDYEDSHDVALVHPNAPTIPAALAVAEAFGPVNGRQLITSIAVGCDIAVRLALATKVSIADFGWYPPPIFAAFGATAAAASILQLEPKQIRDALSLTLCQATCSNEIIHSPHSVIRAVRDAFASRAGVTSALLAQRGVRGFDEPLEGRAGFFASFARGQYEPAVLLDGLGERFEITNISFKPWPSCRGTHAAIEAAIECHSQDIRPADIERITITGGRMLQMLAEPLASKMRPATAIDAKFSLPFTVASALTHGRVGLQSFLPDAIAEEAVLTLAAKVRVQVDPAPRTAIGAVLAVRLRDGSERRFEVLTPLGNPAHPMSEASLTDKFVECAALAAQPPREALARLFASRILSLETVDDVSAQLMHLLH